MRTLDIDPSIPAAELPGAARQAAEAVIEINVAGIVGPARAMRLSAPAYALALWPSGDEDDLVAQAIGVGLEPDRAAALERLPRRQAFHHVWNAAQYAVELQYDPHPRDSTRFARAERLLASALHAQGVLDPARWAMNEVAQRLRHLEVVAPRTDDFVAYAFDYAFGPDLLANLRFAASPATVMTLRRKGLLPCAADVWPLP